MLHPERDDIIAILNWLHRYAPDKAKTLEQQLDLTGQRLDYWRDVIKRIRIPRDQQTGLFEQFDGFFKLVLIHGSTIVALDVLVTWKN